VTKRVSAGRQRLDLLLVDRGLAESRERAQALILAGQVEVDGRRAVKAGDRVDASSGIRVRTTRTWDAAA
jgi:23S rRNA (cytidine1920-2'-O)/16S rRNA (cytidine1409-2'-O)-methyltransferase